MSPARDETTPGVLLAHHLKQLKLPTVLREYDKVARECAQGGLDHPRYLLRLVELELIDRERRMVERRTRAARSAISRRSAAANAGSRNRSCSRVPQLMSGAR